MTSATRLYTPELLGLAVELADYPITEALTVRSEARSPTCGSVIELSLAVSDGGDIERVGLKCQACAVGQAAAAIFAKSASGACAPDIKKAMSAIERWFEGGRLPDWPGFDALSDAQEYVGRHGAILLPWKAAYQALSSVPAHG